MRTRLLIAAAMLAAGAPLRAQVSVVDEGSFTITVGGRTGREDFRIVRAPVPGGMTLVASGTSVVGTARTVAVLRTDTTGAPIAYQLEAREGGEVRERITAQVSRDRLAMRSQTPRGESAREYFLRDGMLILDEGEAHQYYFLTLLARDTVTAVLPRRNVIAQFRVLSRGDEPIEIAGANVVARHYVVGDAASERQLWTDAAGRVLRVEAPALGLVAVRDALPVEH
ncbi:MAG: hypothetical protein HOQ09_01250 [Gemmatimonadaceae bacterium]|nr:hypothetical protein [Gemmatimonadaceae bacterium]